GGIERRTSVMRVGVAVEVPGRVDKSVHRVGLAARRTATFWACCIQEFRHIQQRRPTRERDVNVVREQYGQLAFGYRHDAILLAIEHGNRRAPITLARYAPVL